MFRSVICLALAGLVALPAFAQGKGYSSLVAKVKKEVVRDFKDPDGAKFRDLALYQTQTGKTGDLVCGQVNGKNSYGAFVGYRNFVYADGLIAIEEADGSGTYPILSEAICHKRLRSIE